MNNLQQQGRAHYKTGDYRKALECFDRAIGRGSSVQLLDNRAACYEKLNELSSALKDAKAAIQLHREDATGYLRAGKVLVKMEKHSVAHEIFRHGLKSIKHVGKGYELLKIAHKEVQDIVSPPKSVDPLTMLPRELAETILEYLSFRQRIIACRVSKGWAQFIRSTPDLWSHLDLSGAQRKKVRSSFISRAINVGRSKLRKASLSMLYDFEKTFGALVKQCPLEELTLYECGMQTSQTLGFPLRSAKYLKRLTIGQGTVIIEGHLERILEAIPSLESFSCTGPGFEQMDRLNCPQLLELSIKPDNSRISRLLLREIHKFPNLRSLTVYQSGYGFDTANGVFDFTCCPQLAILDISTSLDGTDTIQLPESLRTLRIAPMASQTRIEGVLACLTQPGTVIYLPKLEKLAITLSTDQTTTILTLLEKTEQRRLVARSSEEMSKLSSLTMDNATIDDEVLGHLLSNVRLRELEHLSLTYTDCDDDTISHIAGRLPNLRSLDLTATLVTGVGIKEMLKARKLELLILNDCRKLGVDAVEWARSQGVTVKYKMKSDVGSGKKVRYLSS